MIRAQVIIRPRASIFDPQGDAVQRAIQHLGVATVKQAHVGKFVELEIESDDVATARTELETICRDLLSNPVIEDYVLTLDGDKKPEPAPAASEITEPGMAEEAPKPAINEVEQKPEPMAEKEPESAVPIKTPAKPKAAAKKAAAKKKEKKTKLTKAEKKAEKKAAKKAAKEAKKRARKRAKASKE